MNITGGFPTAAGALSAGPIRRVRRPLSLVLFFLGAFGLVLAHGTPYATAQDAHGAVLSIDGPIDPISARFLGRGIDKAVDDDASLVIVVLDTPGGRLDSTRDMVADILLAEIAVVVYVSPAGAQAASAGTFIAAAAHVAAMAPTTNIGAASPVGPSGEDLPDTLASKATQDAAAFIRSIADERGRNADALEQTVLEAVSYSASEALEIDIIDLIARDLGNLLDQIDGLTVLVRDQAVVLDTSGLSLHVVERTLVERFLGFLADPNIAFLLLSIGGLGILLELLSPGIIVPGVIGAIALALSFVAAGSLPVNWAGVGLLLFGLLLFFFEMQAPGIGIFGVGGAVSFVLGAFLLFGGFTPEPISGPSFRVNVWLIVGVSASLFGTLVLFVRLVLFTKVPPIPTTLEKLLGVIGVVHSDLDPKGMVRMKSELWTAESDDGKVISAGEKVVVSDLEGLTLKVMRTDE